MKRVYCLYRVSTEHQLLKDDIPMQRHACRQFAEDMRWFIIKEFYEKGVSGYKTATQDRDMLRQIRKDVELNRFDILLVFMFDRLGRRDNETPFFVEWLVTRGIEVWSVIEGQQRLDNHVDKLMNYIRYWQASGESIKTSIRTRTRLGQIVAEGKFRGGTCPYGYHLVKQGRIGKHGRELFDIQIDHEEALVVHKIFDLCIRYGYGSRRIASNLYEQGICNKRGELFHYSTIASILKNVMYTGVLRSGESKSDVLQELQIIDEQTFRLAQEIIKCRSTQYKGPSSIPKKITGKALLSGNVFCGQCGGRIFATTAQKSHHPTKSPERIPIYKCYNRTQHKGCCTGQTTYRAHRIDALVFSEIEKFLSDLSNNAGEEMTNLKYRAKTAEYRERLTALKCQYERSICEINKLKKLLYPNLDPLSATQIIQQINFMENNLSILHMEIQEYETLLINSNQILNSLKCQHKQLQVWATSFRNSEREVQKMIASRLIKEVQIYDYDHIKINFYESMLTYMMEL